MGGARDGIGGQEIGIYGEREGNVRRNGKIEMCGIGGLGSFQQQMCDKGVGVNYSWPRN